MPPAELILPSAGPDPIPWDTALAAILGYARGRRPLHFRSPSHPEGRWVHVPAFGYARFDVRPRSAAPLGEADILTAEGLHGRLDPAGWAALRTTLEDVRPLARSPTRRSRRPTAAPSGTSQATTSPSSPSPAPSEPRSARSAGTR